ncbi:SDR family oxidoreductase [Kribbella sp. NPDC006257]|uniref:SDR family oxidoreductase n=1 Tax=Kribbella sp. NPDC006257 TaxID=3156738 RepID=UPI0033B627FC
MSFETATALDVTTEDIATAVASVIRPQQRLVSLVLDGMRERGWGRILAVSATNIVEPLPALTLSNIARPALAGYLKSLATQVAPDGVTVNLLLAGGSGPPAGRPSKRPRPPGPAGPPPRSRPTKPPRSRCAASAPSPSSPP